MNLAGLYYYLLPDVAVINTDHGNILLKSDSLSFTLEKEAALLFSETILPLLDGKTNFKHFTEKLPLHISEALQRNIDRLAEVGFLKKNELPLNELGGKAISLNQSNFFGQFNLNNEEIISKLQKTRIGIFGLEAHGALLAQLLSNLGIGFINLYDPFTLNEENRKILSAPNPVPENISRQDYYKNWFRNLSLTSQFNVGPSQLNKDEMMKAAQDNDILISCFDKGFTSCNYWINEAAVSLKKIALYSELRGFICRIGPTYLPEETPCYMCYSMRCKGNAENFNEAMLYEKYLDDKKEPIMHKREILPSSYYFAAGILSAEVIKIITRVTIPTLAAKVIIYDLVNLMPETHKFLYHPDCPICQKKNFYKISHPSLSELLNNKSIQGDILSQKKNLLSSHVGIIQNFKYLHKDISDPYLPHVFQAKISNHNFLNEEDVKRSLYCSGKGFTLDQANISALGEAAERYASARQTHHNILYSDYYENSGNEKLDPSELVLYHSSQYANINFAPYNRKNKIGWSLAWCLVKDKPIYVPSLSVFMNYQPADEDNFFIQATSNGLAGGPTLTDAIVSAAFEVIERDAFIIMWHAKLTCKKINIRSHPDKNILDLYFAYKSRNVELHLFQLPTDVPCVVFMALGIDKNGNLPSTVIGLGTDVNPAFAARQALLEFAQVHPALKQKCRLDETKKRQVELFANPQLVDTLEDHDLLFTHPGMLNAFDFLFEQSEEEINWIENYAMAAKEKLKLLISHFKANNTGLIYYNLTAPELEGMHLYAARVIIPGFQPVHFGAKNIRLGGKRLFQLPYKLKLRPHSLLLEDINYLPHPLA